MAYFLVSVSNRTNLDLCVKHALAGFTNSINGLWTFGEIKEGDYVSFLYGARVSNLYKVTEKRAFKNADKLPPWPSVTFRMSGITYYFPFRLYLKPIRELNEPMVRPEFAYVAENLLLRGGYRKTHFQADQTTLHAVSQMGELYTKPIDELNLSDYETFSPKLTWAKSLVKIPETFYFQELILQSVIRHYLSGIGNLQDFFHKLGLHDLKANDFEVLGEKALPEGHVDLLIKDSRPIGISRKIIIEVKTGAVNGNDVKQLSKYRNETGYECIAGILIGRQSSTKTLREATNEKITVCSYSFEDVYKDSETSFEELIANLHITVPMGVRT
ncbi:MAG: hypothetical protein JW732_00470 [Dehalococcoidia bacterium]|nr:hypothetical protein [Dehalococcoidia bacterium]